MLLLGWLLLLNALNFTQLDSLSFKLVSCAVVECRDKSELCTKMESEESVEVVYLKLKYPARDISFVCENH